MKRQTIYSGSILTLYKLGDRYEVVAHQDAVCVLALRGDLVLGVRQSRPALGGDTWELPAGLIDKGEDPASAAKRELAEEAQLTGALTLISQAYTSPGYCNEKIYIFEATGLSPAAGERDEGEELSIEWRDLGEAWQEVREGRLATSAPTALALAYALGRKGGR